MCALTTILISSVRALRKGNKVCRLRAVLPLPLAQQGHVQLSFSPSVLNTGCSTQRLDFELYIETQANTRVQGCDIGLYSDASTHTHAHATRASCLLVHWLFARFALRFALPRRRRAARGRHRRGRDRGLLAAPIFGWVLLVRVQRLVWCHLRKPSEMNTGLAPTQRHVSVAMHDRMQVQKRDLLRVERGDVIPQQILRALFE